MTLAPAAYVFKEITTKFFLTETLHRERRPLLMQMLAVGLAVASILSGDIDLYVHQAS